MPYKVHPVIFSFKIKISKHDSDNESRVYKPQITMIQMKY